MTRRQHQKQLGQFRSEGAKNVYQNLFLPPMRGAAEKNWPSRINSGFDKSSRRSGSNGLMENVVLNITDRLNMRRCNAEVFPSFGIFDCWHARKIEPSKNRPDQSLETPKPSFGTR